MVKRGSIKVVIQKQNESAIFSRDHDHSQNHIVFYSFMPPLVCLPMILFKKDWMCTSEKDKKNLTA